jgi:hypothetical protein
VDGLADRTLDSLKACGFDEGVRGRAGRTLEASTPSARGARRFAAAGGTPLSIPPVCKWVAFKQWRGAGDRKNISVSGLQFIAQGMHIYPIVR